MRECTSRPEAGMNSFTNRPDIWQQPASASNICYLANGEEPIYGLTKEAQQFDEFGYLRALIETEEE